MHMWGSTHIRVSLVFLMALRNTMIKSNFQFVWHKCQGRSSNRYLEADIETEAMEKCFSLSCSPCFTQFTLFNNPELLAQGQYYSPISTINQEMPHRLAYRPPKEPFSQLWSIFRYFRLYQNDKKLICTLTSTY